MVTDLCLATSRSRSPNYSKFRVERLPIQKLPNIHSNNNRLNFSPFWATYPSSVIPVYDAYGYVIPQNAIGKSFDYHPYSYHLYEVGASVTVFKC